MLKLIQKFVIHHSYVRKILNTGRLYRGLVITTDKSYNWPIYTKEEVNASI